MTEDKFEDFLKKTAQSYNAPPARAPREEMWQAIQATRNAGPRVVYGGAVHSGAIRGRFGSKVWWAAAAAVVLVAGGIGVGRWTASPDAPAINTAAGNRQSPAAPTSADEPADDRPTQLVAGENSAPVRRGTERSATPPGRNSSGAIAGVGTASSAGSVTGLSSSPAYQIAAANHLTQAEALLTSFRTRSAADQQIDAQLARWARELLTNTRLLLDSPIAVDPERRPLLQDLELLLAQIVQLSPGSTSQDREIIEQTLMQDRVLTRLRTAIPAGQRGS